MRITKLWIKDYKNLKDFTNFTKKTLPEFSGMFLYFINEQISRAEQYIKNQSS